MESLEQIREQFRQRWYQQGFYTSDTLRDVIEANAGRGRDGYVATESDVRPCRVTYDEAYQQSVQLASALYQLGVRCGDRVAIQLPNWTESMLISEACILLGAVFLPITAIFGASELEFIVADAGASVLFIPGQWRSRDYRETVPRMRQQDCLRHVVVLADSAPEGAITWQQLLAMASGEFTRSAARADDLALLIYTSGTTGRPKGVQHTHNTLLSECRASPAFLGEAITSTILNPWPYGHIASIIPYVRFWSEGVSVVMTDRWEADAVARLVKQHQVGTTSGVPYFLSSLVEAADTQGIDISPLKNYGTGATNVPTELVRLCTERGMFCYRMYGSTEHPTSTSGQVGDPVEKCITTDGRALPGCEVRIIDEAENVQPVGEEGEVVVIGPEQFIGYHNPEQNRTAFTADGWFKTGDIGRLDGDGYLTITDRKKDIIIRGGENISSREVEECLLSHPRVVAAAAVAYPDVKLGEKICVFLELRGTEPFALEDIARHFEAQQIARQKTPEHLRIIDELPRTATGKVNKQVLRERLRAEG